MPPPSGASHEATSTPESSHGETVKVISLISTSVELSTRFRNLAAWEGQFAVLACAVARKLRFSIAMPRQTATNAKPLAPAARKARVAKIAQSAPAKVLAGINMMDFREPTAREREIGEALGRARAGKSKVA
jgi:hypothetical protein